MVFVEFIHYLSRRFDDSNTSRRVRMTAYEDRIILHGQLHHTPIRRNDRLRLELLCDMFPNILQILRFLFPVNDQHSIWAVLDISVRLCPKRNVQVVCRFFHISGRKAKDWYAFWYT